jgi:hypothetical protein
MRGRQALVLGGRLPMSRTRWPCGHPLAMVRTRGKRPEQRDWYGWPPSSFWWPSRGRVPFTAGPSTATRGAWPSPASHGSASAGGSKMADHRPLGGPSKRPVCREKTLGSTIRALWGRGWTCLPGSQTQEVLPQRGMPLAHHRDGAAGRGGLPATGVRDRHHGPLRGTNETASLQGKSSGVHDSRPLGAAMGSSG